MIDILMKAPLFQHVSSEAISGFLEKIPYRVESYREHDVVALQGTPCNHLMVVLKGLLQGQMVNDAGKLVVIEELTPSRLLAPAFLFAPKHELPVNIIAVEPSEVLFISSIDFTEWMQSDKQVLQNFLMLISGRTSFLTDKIMFLSLKNIKNKIADYLLLIFLLRMPRRSNCPILSRKSPIDSGLRVLRWHVHLPKWSRRGLSRLTGRQSRSIVCNS